MDSRTAFRKFKLRVNKLDTNFTEHIDEKKFCEIFNKARLHLLNKLLSSEDGNKDIAFTLQYLLKEVRLEGLQDKNVYLVDIPTDWYWIKRVSCTDTKCKNTLNCILVQESNVGKLLQNDNWKPSVEWEETIFTVGGNKLRIYTDDFSVESCQLIYYREPINIDISTGENNIYGKPSKDINPEETDSLIEDILDLAVLIASSDISDLQNFSSKGQVKQITG